VRDGGSGAVLGEVSDVLSAPTHEILELRPPDGGAPVLVPLVEELVWEDGAGGLTVRAGLLEGQQRRPAGASGDADQDEGPGREDG